ncbi:MAG: AraC family transcriptional regulator [Cellulomonadaceae bacterium]|nr:AraC family transcriptional regulator [Cellulomonadaceae bacterium]
MVRTGHPAVRDVGYHPPVGQDAGAEVTDLAALVRRGGLAEFVAPQRPAFELVVQVTSGQTWHELDFSTYALAPGDVLWVHAGQVQRWGDIGGLEGRALLFPPALVDAPTSDLLRVLGASTRSFWGGAATDGSSLDVDLAALEAAAVRLGRAERMDPAARSAALTHAISYVLLRLASETTVGTPAPVERDEVFRWFEDEIDKRFASERSVAGYARLLGYSARTLNRSARAHAGTSAKALIDRRVVLEAKRLLAHETVPVADIAARLGFDDPANFSKYFTLRAGATPAEFRRRARGPR